MGEWPKSAILYLFSCQAQLEQLEEQVLPQLELEVEQQLEVEHEDHAAMFSATSLSSSISNVAACRSASSSLTELVMLFLYPK